MAKNVSMTRERKIALPVILEAARNYQRTLEGETVAVAQNTRHRLADALKAFEQ